MELTFLYHPVKNIEKAVAFYRDILGWDEAWRMGDDTAAMQIPNSPIMVMLAIDQDPSARASGFFGIDDVDAFYRDNRDRIDFVDEPRDLPRFATPRFVIPTRISSASTPTCPDQA
jgi:catechol 2,3-dioxygenase-like lactoylglutathione lyase family enzyme